MCADPGCALEWRLTIFLIGFWRFLETSVVEIRHQIMARSGSRMCNIWSEGGLNLSAELYRTSTLVIFVTSLVASGREINIPRLNYFVLLLIMITTEE